jgi:hypothetical protein
MSRQYLKRTLGFSWAGKALEVSPYYIAQNMIDADGTCDGSSFDSLSQLVRTTSWDKPTMDGFIARLQELLQSKPGRDTVII